MHLPVSRPAVRTVRPLSLAQYLPAGDGGAAAELQLPLHLPPLPARLDTRLPQLPVGRPRLPRQEGALLQCGGAADRGRGALHHLRQVHKVREGSLCRSGGSRSPCSSDGTFELVLSCTAAMHVILFLFFSQVSNFYTKSGLN